MELKNELPLNLFIRAPSLNKTINCQMPTSSSINELYSHVFEILGLRSAVQARLVCQGRPLIPSFSDSLKSAGITKNCMIELVYPFLLGGGNSHS
jgi:hypothetical protein